jgi:tetratricopeptide (TPR) repeat protein
VDLVRLIKEEEPPRPSVRLSTSGALPKFAAGCGTQPAQLPKQVRGELDWIVMKCLEKDRTRRYETVNGLARDVQRYLKDEPVEACPPSPLYRMRKLAAKHRGLLTTAASFAALLVIGCIISTGLAIWAMRAQNQAQTALASERVAREEAVAAKERADAAARRLSEATQIADDGIGYYNRRNWSAAHEHFTRAMQIEPGLNTPYNYRGALYAYLGLWDKAAADYDHRFRLVGNANMETWFDYLLLKAYTGDDAGYRTACMEMLRQHKNSADVKSRLLVVRSCLFTPRSVGDPAELCNLAESLVASANVPWHLGIAGRAYLQACDFPKAEARCREAIKLGTGSPNGVHRMHQVNLALALHEQGKTVEAKKALGIADQAKDQWTARMQEALVGTPPIGWNDWLEFLMLHRQATERITGAPPTDDPRLAALYEKALATVTYGDVFTFMDNGRGHVRRQEWDQAASSFAQVLDKLPAGFFPATEEMRFCIEMVQRPEVFDRLVKLRPEEFKLWFFRGRSYAASGEWIKGTNDYKHALALLTPDLSLTGKDRGPWYGWGGTNHELGAMLLLAGDEVGYQELCRTVLATPAPLDDAFVCFCVSRTCTMTADAVTDFSIPLQTAQYAVEKQPRIAWYLYALGIAQHRAGKHEEAIQSLKRSLAVNENWVGRGQNYATLALACHSLNRDEEARQWLSQTRSWLNETNRSAASWTFGYAATSYLNDWLTALVLLREAEKLLAANEGS